MQQVGHLPGVVSMLTVIGPTVVHKSDRWADKTFYVIRDRPGIWRLLRRSVKADDSKDAITGVVGNSLRRLERDTEAEKELAAVFPTLAAVLWPDKLDVGEKTA